MPSIMQKKLTQRLSASRHLHRSNRDIECIVAVSPIHLISSSIVVMLHKASDIRLWDLRHDIVSLELVLVDNLRIFDLQISFTDKATVDHVNFVDQ